MFIQGSCLQCDSGADTKSDHCIFGNCLEFSKFTTKRAMRNNSVHSEPNLYHESDQTCSLKTVKLPDEKSHNKWTI